MPHPDHRRTSPAPTAVPARGATAPVVRPAAAVLTLALALTACSAAGGTPRTDVRADLEEVFTDAGVVGTFAAYDTATGEMAVVFPDEVDRREFPASTFKIPNSLISLETGAVADADEVVPYGGEPQRLPQWEHDMSMRDAFAISAFPIYQELARRIGHDRMATWVERFGYGSGDIGGADDLAGFWLHGPLRISAKEHVLFLDRLTSGDLPVDAEHIDTVASFMDQDIDDPGARDLYWKTGWADGPDPMVGWLVGWVEDGDHVTTFALRLELEDDADAELREPLVRDLLDRLEVLPEQDG